MLPSLDLANLDYFIRYGCKRSIAQILENNPPNPPNVYMSPDMIAFLESKGMRFGMPTIHWAGAHGHLDMVQYFHEHGRWAGTSEMCNLAAENGHLNVLRYLHENGFPWDESFTLAASSGNLDVLKYLYEHGCPWGTRTAAASINLAVLRYLHENGCPWDEYTFTRAACRGNLDVLKYLYENGCPWGTDTSAASINVKVLTYLHENGCPMGPSTCNRAAEEGHFRVLKYAYDLGIPWDDTAFPCPRFSKYLRVRGLMSGHDVP